MWQNLQLPLHVPKPQTPKPQTPTVPTPASRQAHKHKATALGKPVGVHQHQQQYTQLLLQALPTAQASSPVQTATGPMQEAALPAQKSLAQLAAEEGISLATLKRRRQRERQRAKKAAGNGATSCGSTATLPPGLTINPQSSHANASASQAGLRHSPASVQQRLSDAQHNKCTSVASRGAQRLVLC